MRDEVRDTFSAIQHQAASELLHLLDGFFDNLEHGLFELAFQFDDATMQSRCATFMREMRIQKPRMLRRFVRLVEADEQLWVGGARDTDNDEGRLIEARSLAGKYTSHFDTVLGSIARCAAQVTGRDGAEVEVPIEPTRLTYNFLTCLDASCDDPDVSVMLKELFARLVLDRLGPIYGISNSRLHRSLVDGLELPPESPDDPAGDIDAEQVA